MKLSCLHLLSFGLLLSLSSPRQSDGYDKDETTHHRMLHGPMGMKGVKGMKDGMGMNGGMGMMMGVNGVTGAEPPASPSLVSQMQTQPASTPPSVPSAVALPNPSSAVALTTPPSAVALPTLPSAVALPTLPSAVALPTLPPSSANSNQYLICKVDIKDRSVSIPRTDPRFYSSADTVPIVYPVEIHGDPNEKVKEAGEIVSVVADASTLAAEYLPQFEKLAKLAPVVSVAINVFLLFAPEPEDPVLIKLDEINSRLTAIQLQIRQVFLDLSQLISDIELDEYSSQLDSISRAFNDYAGSANQSNSLLSYYEPRLRSVCNEPFKTPLDIFYNLYGYACDNCTFASRKRANLLSIATEKFKIDSVGFSRNFGDFILKGMFQASVFHAMCLPPISGACVNSFNDALWQANIVKMGQAYNEANRVIQSKVAEITDWVPDFRLEEDLKPLVTAGGGDNQRIADNIRNYFTEKQGGFDFQVLVSTDDREHGERNVWTSTTCFNGKDAGGGQCTTIRSRTGHTQYDNVEGKSISIRYRLKTLPLANQLWSENLNFRDFYVQKIVNPNVCASAPGCPCDGNTALMCAIAQCFSCNPDENAKFVDFIGSFYIVRNKPGGTDTYINAKEATTNEGNFPRFDHTIFTDSFRFYYG